jgi:hypothetical protein
LTGESARGFTGALLLIGLRSERTKRNLTAFRFGEERLGAGPSVLGGAGLWLAKSSDVIDLVWVPSCAGTAETIMSDTKPMNSDCFNIAVIIV